MIEINGNTAIYLACGGTDGRKSFQGLTAIIKLEFELDPYSKSMFVFCNKGRNVIKILQWDGSGFWLFIKRLDRGQFQWPQSKKALETVTKRQLYWLIEGLSLEQRGAFLEHHPTVFL